MATRLSHLSLSTKKQENDADELLSSLTVMAYPTEANQPPVKTTKKKKKVERGSKTTTERRSRFFYRPTKSFDEELNARKKTVEPHALKIITEEVDTRRAVYADELPSILQTNIETVREFFLKDLGPLTLATQAGSAQAREVVQRTLNAEIDNAPFAQFERMVATASQIKMARYIAKYMGLPRATAEALVSSIQPRPPANIVFPSPHPDDERRPPPTRVTTKPQPPKPNPSIVEE